MRYLITTPDINASLTSIQRKCNLTQTQLAQVIGCTSAQLSRFMNKDGTALSKPNSMAVEALIFVSEHEPKAELDKLIAIGILSGKGRGLNWLLRQPVHFLASSVRNLELRGLERYLLKAGK